MNGCGGQAGMGPGACFVGGGGRTSSSESGTEHQLHYCVHLVYA